MSLAGPPLIGITVFRRFLATPLGAQTDLYTLDPAYADRVAEAGGVPLLLPHGDDPGPLLDHIDGVLLSGGGDIHPEAYGAEVAGSLEDGNDAADRWEVELVREARRRRMPVLGICRGAQTMVVACGGALAQAIPQTVDHPAGPVDPAELLAARHPVDIEPGSRLARILATTRASVNSIHHQAVTDPGDLKISGRCGSLVEAIEAADGWHAVGVQWHPEKMNEPEQSALFTDLVDAARSDAARRRVSPLDAKSVSR